MNDSPDSEAGYVFLKILAPGLSESFPEDAKLELSAYMAASLYGLSAEVDGLSIGTVASGSMEVLIRSADDVWTSAQERVSMLILVADAYAAGMSQLEFAGNFGNNAQLQAAFNAASTASAQSMYSKNPRAFWHHPGMLPYGNVTIKTVIPSTREASTCAALCSNDAECLTFAYSFLERLCFLFTDAQMNLCDPEVSDS